MDIKELKARAYDLILSIERLQIELQETNKKISDLAKEAKESSGA